MRITNIAIYSILAVESKREPSAIRTLSSVKTGVMGNKILEMRGCNLL